MPDSFLSVKSLLCEEAFFPSNRHLCQNNDSMIGPQTSTGISATNLHAAIEFSQVPEGDRSCITKACVNIAKIGLCDVTPWLGMTPSIARLLVDIEHVPMFSSTASCGLILIPFFSSPAFKVGITPVCIQTSNIRVSLLPRGLPGGEQERAWVERRVRRGLEC